VKTVFVFAFLVLIGLAAPAFAQTTNANLIGTYAVDGTETDGGKYEDGNEVVVTMDKSGALELKWNGGEYVGVGQVSGNQLFIGSVAEGKVILLVMDIKGEGSLEGKWWRRTDAGTKGTEVWKKK